MTRHFNAFESDGQFSEADAYEWLLSLVPENTAENLELLCGNLAEKIGRRVGLTLVAEDILGGDGGAMVVSAPDNSWFRILVDNRRPGSREQLVGFGHELGHIYLQIKNNCKINSNGRDEKIESFCEWFGGRLADLISGPGY